MTNSGEENEQLVTGELAGGTLDRVLVALWPDRSRAAWQKSVRRGDVRVDGRPTLRSNVKLQKGQRISVAGPGQGRDRRQAAPAPIEQPRVLYEDEHLLALDKPNGWLTHMADRATGPNLVTFGAQLGALADGDDPDRPGIVHRLDRGTTGVILLARTQQAMEELRNAFRFRLVEKRYLAIVHGSPRDDEFSVDMPLRSGRDGADRQLAGHHAAAKEARTGFRVLERLGRASLVECLPETGRRHQIRVHLFEADHAVLNDPLYRAPAEERQGMPRLPRGRHALHAAGLRLRHPVGDDWLEIESPLPSDLCKVLEGLENGRHSSDR